MAPLDGIPYIPSGDKGGGEEDGCLMFLVGLAVSAVLVFIAWFGIRLLFLALRSAALAVPGSYFTAALIGLGVLVAGALLYLLRVKMRATYAYLELGAGIGMGIEGWLRWSPTQNTAALLVAVLAAVYVVVRAFDNLSQARKEREARVQRNVASAV